MEIRLEDHLRSVTAPANLRINDQIQKYREVCRRHGCERPYHHFAFGQSPFPPPETVVRALADNAAEHDYLPTAGLGELRQAVARFHNHHFGLDTTAERVVVGPGSKELISILLGVLQGIVLIPTPSWVSYLPQARILKKEVIALRTQREDDYKLTPGSLERSLESIPAGQKILILNTPNNPTGAVYSEEELRGLAEACRRHGVVVISDEIYALTSFEPALFTSMQLVYPEGTVVTSGLSKDRSFGGYRLGVAFFPAEPLELVQDVLKLAGATYFCVAAPIQLAALATYSLDKSVETHMRQCREINALVGRKTAELFGAVPGLKTSTPQGAFYLYVDFNEQREQLFKLGLNRCIEFAEHLLQVEHAALLPGEALLLPDTDFSTRCSFVDYNGEQVLECWKVLAPQTAEEQERFFRENCPLIVDGVKGIGRYVEQVRAGKMPEHVM